jgi:uncharacterized membrane protein YphA (DoxX/SURF4 family)
MEGTNVHTYTPELQPRRSELVAWGLAVASLFGLLLLNLGGMVYFWAIIFVAFMFFAAMSISLGNWMDRQTRIVIDEYGVTYNNGLRHVNMEWRLINNVTTFPSRWGVKVQVLGDKGHFDFNTLGEVTFQHRVQGHVGFQQGDKIKEEIIGKSGLTLVAKKGDSYYYSRP